MTQAIIETLQANGHSTWKTLVGHVRTSASINEARAIFAVVDYPAHLIAHNTSFAKSATGEFKTLIRIS